MIQQELSGIIGKAPSCNPEINDQIRKEITCGVADDETMKRYCLSKMQLAGHKAFVNRGKGTIKRGLKSRKLSANERNEIEHFLTQEDYASSRDDHQITSAYNITPQQLAGIKAVITKRKKRNECEKNGFGSVRLAILERDGNRCQYTVNGTLCVITQAQHMQRYDHGLHVHHIDYNHQNNDHRNMISLCVAHHAMTNTVQHAHKMKIQLERRISEIYRAGEK